MTEPITANSQDDARARILIAARRAFAITGFDGTTLRDIARDADVTHQLLVYHFKTKDGLWRAMMESLLARSSDYQPRRDHDPQLSAAQALRRNIERLVSFSARYPEFHRIWALEAQVESDRTNWLIAQYVKPAFRASVDTIRAAQSEGAIRPGDPVRLYYGLLGLVVTPFVFSREVKNVAEIDPFSPEQVQQTLALALSFFGLLPAQS